MASRTIRILFASACLWLLAAIAAWSDESPVAPANAAPGAVAGYRLRSDTTNLEFITPALLRTLRESESVSEVVGEVPWGWQRLDSVPEGTVVLQVVPDLQVTGGSSVCVAARVISYPLMIPLTVLAPFFEVHDWLNGDAGVPIDEFVHDIWTPVRVAYRFNGDFLEAALLRDGVEVPPILATRDCATTRVWMARTPDQEPRRRKIRGCWGSSTYPAEAFAPGAQLEVRVLETSEETSPRTVPLPGGLVARIHADLTTPPPEGEGEERQEVQP